MSYASLLANLGFELDPFAQTNADEEDRLSNYFIEPPFFNAVHGDLASPKSAVVFAPRGGGKTALKRMLELSSQTEPFLCVTYNNFSVDGLRVEDVVLAHHLRSIVRLLVVAIISAAAERGIGRLSKGDRHLLYLLTKEHLTGIDTTELKAAVRAVQCVSDKAKEWWNAYTGALGIIINAVLNKIGLGDAELASFRAEQGALGQLVIS
jgi:hypothetical protein